MRLLAIFLIVLIASMPLTFALELKLTYDANGNLVSGDGKYRTYNSLNQLSAIYNGTDATGMLLESYTYHPTEERILVKKSYFTNGSVNQTIYYLSPTFVRVSNASGNYDYTYINHEGQLVAQSVNGVKLFIHGNHEGSSSVVTNSSGSVVENTTYTPFGEQLTGGTQTRYGYEGREADSLVGDTDFRARKYQPQYGIFTQPDSLLPNFYDPQSLNRYSFERNNPYKYIDPSGHVYWGELTVSIIDIVSSGFLAVVGISTASTGVGIVAGVIGFAGIGKGVEDAAAAIQEDEGYFANNPGGIIQTTSKALGGERGSKIGKYMELGITLASIRNQPVPGKSKISDYINAVNDIMSFVTQIIPDASKNTEDRFSIYGGTPKISLKGKLVQLGLGGRYGTFGCNTGSCSVFYGTKAERDKAIEEEGVYVNGQYLGQFPKQRRNKRVNRGY